MKTFRKQIKTFVQIEGRVSYQSSASVEFDPNAREIAVIKGLRVYLYYTWTLFSVKYHGSNVITCEQFIPEK